MEKKNLPKRIEKKEPMTLSEEGAYLLSLINKNVGKIEELDRRTAKNTRGLRDIEEEYPLLPPEADDLAKEVKRKGVEVLGGKKSNAYQETGLRKRVYMDIYGEIKRNYGLIRENGAQESYKKLKRKYLKGAISVVCDYIAPIALQNEIDDLNDLEDIDE